VAFQLWGPKTVVIVFAIAGGLIGGDIALWLWDEPVSMMIAIGTGLVTGGVAGRIIAWFVRQMGDLGGS
jgi:hypothetical protein